MYLDEYLSVLPGPAKRAAYRAVWNPDKWNRQSLVAGFADGWGTGLDVGGRASEMNSLCAVTRFISCNPQAPADVILPDGDPTLPFSSGAFDVVTSSDVIEHIPAPARMAHIDELLRVASRRVVVCFPLGTDPHIEAERQLASKLVGLGLPVPEFLSEHLEFGLPTPEQVTQMASESQARSTQVLFQGDFSEGDEMLLAWMKLRYRFDLRALRAFVAAGRRVRRQTQLLPFHNATTARVFLVIDLASARG